MPYLLDAQGWTLLAPSGDSRVVFVSDSDGDNADDGLSSGTAKKTISAGLALLRDGFPDWLMLKCGDTFTVQSLGSIVKDGRSASEPMVYTSYGSGARPHIKTGTSNGLSIASSGTHASFLRFVGLFFDPHTRDGSQGSTGMQILRACTNILFEDCFWQRFKDNIMLQADDGDGSITDITFRRCHSIDSFSTVGSHSQGIFASGVDGLTVEECNFDRNGWAGDHSPSVATVFNHNSYITDCKNVTLRNNLYMRACSIGNKFAANDLVSENILVEDNFYIEGELGISAGGNESDPLRFKNFTIKKNVMRNIGRVQHPNRNLSWGIDVQDWDGGLIEDNLLLDFLASDSRVLEFTGSSERNVDVHRNIFYRCNDRAIRPFMGGSKTGITIRSNDIQDPSLGQKLIQNEGGFAGISYSGNRYFSTAAANAWFGISGVNKSYAQWVADSGETGSSQGQIVYPDPERNEVSYMTSIGGTPTFDAFMAGALANRKGAWDPKFTAHAINEHIRAGFGRAVTTKAFRRGGR